MLAIERRRPGYAIDARTYGAKGDGVHDDAPSITEAMAVAEALETYIVTLPVGTFYLRTPLVVPARVVVRGSGEGLTTLVPATVVASSIGAGGALEALTVHGWNSGAWSDVTYPTVIGHRGSPIVAPENTFAAFDVAAAIGVPFELDVQCTLDGQLVVMHDATTARTCTTDGTIARLSAAHLTRYDAATYFPGPSNLWVPQRIPTFEAVLRRYRGALIIAECKDSNAATPMARMIHSMGLQKTVSVHSGTTADLAAVLAVDPSIRVGLVTATPITKTAAQSYGISFVSIDYAGLTGQFVTDMHAIGVKVYVYGLTDGTVLDGEVALGYGADALIVGDPGYIYSLSINRTPSGTVRVECPVDWAAFGGWRAIDIGHSQTPVIASGYATWATQAALADFDIYSMRAPIRLAATPATKRIDVSLKCVQATETTSRWFGFGFGFTHDVPTNYFPPEGYRGYHCIMRRSGTWEIARLEHAGAVSLGTKAGQTAISQGDVIPLRIDITGTTITMTRTDNNETHTVNDSTYDRGGFCHAVGSGIVPGLGAITVTQ